MVGIVMMHSCSVVVTTLAAGSACLQVVVAFVRGTHEALAGGAGGWGASVHTRADTPWRRSAVAFLQASGLLLSDRDGGQCCAGRQPSGCCCLAFAGVAGIRISPEVPAAIATAESGNCLLQELGLLTGAHASVVDRIAGEAAALDGWVLRPAPSAA